MRSRLHASRTRFVTSGVTDHRAPGHGFRFTFRRRYRRALSRTHGTAVGGRVRVEKRTRRTRPTRIVVRRKKEPARYNARARTLEISEWYIFVGWDDVCVWRKCVGDGLTRQRRVGAPARIALRARRDPRAYIVYYYYYYCCYRRTVLSVYRATDALTVTRTGPNTKWVTRILLSDRHVVERTAAIGT